MDGGWTSDDRAENHWRRTFCQIPFTNIYEHADKGKRSLHGLVAFFRRKAHAERSASEELRELLHDQVQAEASSLEDLEESGTSIRKALMEVKSFVDATCNHQLLLAKVLEEQVAEPLESLQEASEMYIRILRDEIKNVNDEYAVASSTHKQAATRLQKAMEDLSEAKERQRIALHGIGVPEFELQRLSARVSKCEDEKLQAEMVKAQAKNALYNRIIARDEMAMAVSVAYQKAEEERLDQLKSSLQRFLHVEKDRLKVAEKMLASLEQHVGHIDRSEDIQLLIHNQRNPDNMHFQGKALALLDWHWGKMQTEQAQTRRRGHSIENGVYDASSAESESSTVMAKMTTGRGGDGTSSFVRSSSMSTISAEPVVIPPPPHTTTGAGGDSMKPPPSPHGELAQTPMGLALRRYFANDLSVTPVMQTLRDVSVDDSQKQEQQQHIISKSTAAASATEVDLDNSLKNESLSDAVTAASPPNSSQAESSEDDNAKVSNQTAASPTLARSNSSSLNSGVVKSSCVNQSGRAMFVKCLNRQRSLETKIKDQGSFDELVDCFNVFLSECIRGDDVKAAKTAMILAETFYLPKPAKQRSTSSSSEQSATDSADHSDPFEHNHFHHHGGINRGATRMYLQEEVKKHAIWKNPAFWEKALLLAIGEELQKTPQQAPWEDLPSGVPKHDGLPSREEAVGRVHNIVFGQLGSFTLSMLEFEVPLPQIESFVETMCDAHELTEDQRFLLRKNLHEIFATLR